MYCQSIFSRMNHNLQFPTILPDILELPLLLRLLFDLATERAGDDDLFCGDNDIDIAVQLTISASNRSTRALTSAIYFLSNTKSLISCLLLDPCDDQDSTSCVLPSPLVYPDEAFDAMEGEAAWRAIPSPFKSLLDRPGDSDDDDVLAGDEDGLKNTALVCRPNCAFRLFSLVAYCSHAAFLSCRLSVVES